MVVARQICVLAAFLCLVMSQTSCGGGSAPAANADETFTIADIREAFAVHGIELQEVLSYPAGSSLSAVLQPVVDPNATAQFQVSVYADAKYVQRLLPHENGSVVVKQRGQQIALATGNVLIAYTRGTSPDRLPGIRASLTDLQK